jgi:hypothetical protein
MNAASVEKRLKQGSVVTARGKHHFAHDVA